MSTERGIRLGLILSLAFFAFHACFAHLLQLAPDEAYYWEWSRHLALSYYDQGPMLGLAIRLGTWLGGPGEMGVRLPSLVSGLLLCLMAVWACVRVFKAPSLAPWMVLALNAALLFSVGGVLMVHDSLQVTFWALALCLAVEAARSPSPWWWPAFGLAAACGLMSKYTGAFLLPSVLLAVASHPSLRPQLKRPGFWAGMLAGTAGLIPILIWNWRNAWPSFLHVASLAGGDRSRHSWGTLPEFVGSQLGLITPLLCGLVVWAWLEAWRRFRLGKISGDEWLLWCGSVPLALFFLGLSFFTRVEGNWPAGAYFGGLLLAGALLRSRGLLWSRLSKASLAAGFFFVAVAFGQSAWPFLPFGPSQARLDTVARVDGWRGLAREAQARRSILPAGSFVACTTYQNAAELGFYLPGQPAPLILSEGPINHQYRFWNHPERFLGLDGLVVVERPWEVKDASRHFARLEPLGDFAFSRRGVEIRHHYFFRGVSFKG